MVHSRGHPPDLPGMYFDTERNRYFPSKTSASGQVHSNSHRAGEQLQRDEESARLQRENEILRRRLKPKAGVAAPNKSGNGMDVLQLLQQRELVGHNWKKRSGTNSSAFQRQILESYTCKTQPEIWTYNDIDCRGGIQRCSLEMETMEGLATVKAMIVGGNKELKILQEMEAGKPNFRSWQRRSHGDAPTPEWCNGQRELSPSPTLTPLFPTLPFDPTISSVKKLNEWSSEPCTENDNRVTEHIIVTTLGHGAAGGAVLLLRHGQLCSSEQSTPYVELQIETNSDIYTAECNPRGKQVSLGLGAGAGIVDLDRIEIHRSFYSKSAVLAQHFDSSGNLLLCGHRNGLIVTYDVRSPSVTRSSGTRQKPTKHLGEKIQMGSTICSMSLLRSNEHYLIASSMNGEIEQWDRRMVGRGGVLSFEGHVNTYSSLHFGIDPTETLLASGGEDKALRLWSVKSGALLHVQRSLKCVAKRIQWETSKCRSNAGCWGGYFEDVSLDTFSPWSLWMGSEQLKYMRAGRIT